MNIAKNPGVISSGVNSTNASQVPIEPTLRLDRYDDEQPDPSNDMQSSGMCPQVGTFSSDNNPNGINANTNSSTYNFGPANSNNNQNGTNANTNSTNEKKKMKIGEIWKSQSVFASSFPR